METDGNGWSGVLGREPGAVEQALFLGLAEEIPKIKRTLDLVSGSTSHMALEAIVGYKF